MATEKYKSLSKSKYAGVIHCRLNGYEGWTASKRHNGVRRQKWFSTEREAAIFYDKLCIEFGLPPVNILKPKL